MPEYAILDLSKLPKAVLGEVYAMCLPTGITPAQAALRAMTDGEVAMIMLRRHDSKRDPSGVRHFDRCHIKDAAELGLWPPEVTGSE